MSTDYRTLPIDIDYAQCDRVAGLLRKVGIPNDAEDRVILGLTPADTANFYFLTVAICHQTQGLKGRIQGQLVKGWDYLSQKLESAVLSDRSLLSPQTWASITTEKLTDIFVDPDYGRTLSDSAGRAQLIRELGDVMLAEGFPGVSRMFEISGGCVKDGSPNLLQLIGQFRAFRDPVAKKSYFFLGLMSNSGIWHYVDPANVGAPVDYHEVRGHLRMGTVVVRDAGLRGQLLSGDLVTEEVDIAIRLSVRDAITRIAQIHGAVTPMQLHYLFWNLFRSVCLRAEPLCREAAGCTLPARYAPLLKISSDIESCPVLSICPSSDASARYLEHRFETDWY